MFRSVIVLVLLVVSAYAAYECGIPAFPMLESSYGRRIVGGWEAKPHSFPWQVRLMTTVPGTSMFGSCGGSLVQLAPGNGTDLVISAAHCPHDKTRGWARPSQMTVVVGAHDVGSYNEPSQRHIPVKQYARAAYSQLTKENDIILIKLKEVVPYTEYTRHVCLPKEGEKLPAGSSCMVSGWGTTREEGTSSKLLLQVDVKIYTDEECTVSQSLLSKMFCAGHPEGRKDSCQGDSGGPLVCKTGGKWTQYGVVSFGAGCGRRGAPGVYVNLPQYISWIKQEAKALESAPDLSGGATSTSMYRPSTGSSTAGSSDLPSSPSAKPTLQETYFDSYFLDTGSHLDSIFKLPSAFGSFSLFPQNNIFESAEVSSFFKPSGALKPGSGLSSSFGGFGSNFGSSLFPSSSFDPGVTTTSHSFSSGRRPFGSSSNSIGSSSLHSGFPSSSSFSSSSRFPSASGLSSHFPSSSGFSSTSRFPSSSHITSSSFSSTRPSRFSRF